MRENTDQKYSKYGHFLMQGYYAQQRSLKKDFSFSILMRKCDWFKMIPSENSNSNSFKFNKKNTNVSNGSYICKIDLLFI